MKINELIKEELDKMSSMSFKDKLWYIGAYYKFHFLAVLIAITVIWAVSATVYRSSFKSVLTCVIVNSQDAGAADTTVMEQKLSGYLNLQKKEKLSFESGLTVDYDSPTDLSYAAMAKLSAMIAGKNLDVMIADSASIDHFAEMNGFKNLEEVLPADLLDQVSGSLYYAEDMDGNSYPFAVSLNSIALKEETGLRFDPPLLGIIGNAPYPDNAIALVRFLLESDQIPTAESDGQTPH